MVRDPGRAMTQARGHRRSAGFAGVGRRPSAHIRRAIKDRLRDALLTLKYLVLGCRCLCGPMQFLPRLLKSPDSRANMLSHFLSS